MGFYQALNLDWLIETAKQHAYEYSNTGYAAFGPGASVQVTFCSLSQVAPSETWTWVQRKDGLREASVVRDNVLFYALFTEEEARPYPEAQ